LEDSARVVMFPKTRESDRLVQDFLACHPDAVVVHIGCGLDTRFVRVDNGRVDGSAGTV
jgi:O-methyltransferase involved in polyketide biosynthesis